MSKDESERLVDALVRWRLGQFLDASVWNDPANFRPERAALYFDGWTRPMSIRDLKPEVAQRVLAEFAAGIGMRAGS